MLWHLAFGASVAQLSFSEVGLEAGIGHNYIAPIEMGGGAAFFDYDADGDDDVWITGGKLQDALYENNGHGYFVDVTQKALLPSLDSIISAGVVTADFDNDGHQDVLVLTYAGAENILYRNNGDRTFTIVSHPGLLSRKAFTLSAAIADVDLDGDLDIYVANYIEKNELVYDSELHDVIGFDHACYANQLFINHGDWTFAEMTSFFELQNRGCALASVFTDFDGDADPDLLLANDFGEWISPNALYRNNHPTKQFSDVSAQTDMNIGIYGMGIAIGDYDGDLDLDYYVTNLGRNVLLQNQAGKFGDQTTFAGVEDTYVREGLFSVGWGAAFSDFDNDTDLDLYVANGFVPSAGFLSNAEENPNRLFINNGNGQFEVSSEASSAARGRGLNCADLDLDGDVDFLLVNVNTELTVDGLQGIELYRNDLRTKANWLQISLRGTKVNRDGLGSRVLLYPTGEQPQIREANGGLGAHTSQHSKVLHFGLGSAQSIDSMIVIWPGGHSDKFYKVAPNQRVIATEGGTIYSQNYQVQDQGLSIAAFPNPFHQKTKIVYATERTSKIKISIYDSLGKSVFEAEYFKDPGQYLLHWIAPSPDVYFVKMVSKNARSYHRIVAF